jgi:hypothetical protein
VVAKGAAAMDAQVLETTLKAYVSEIRQPRAKSLI